MTSILLQTCGATDYIQGDWHRCTFEPVVSIIGEPLFGLLLGGVVYLSFYLAGGGRTAAPTVVTILLAALLFPILPGQYVGIGWATLFVGAAAAIFQTLQKYVLSPATT